MEEVSFGDEDMFELEVPVASLQHFKKLNRIKIKIPQKDKHSS